MDDSREGGTARTRVLEGLDDGDLIRALREQDCEGVLWLAAMDEFASYSWRAFVRVFRTGALQSRTSNRNRPIRLSRSEWHLLLLNPGDVEELFYAALEKQIALFTARTCAGEGWDPDGGMPLRDYFFNGVLLQLANPVRAWRRRCVRDGVVSVTDPDDHDIAGRPAPGWGPEETFLATEGAQAVIAALTGADDRLRRAVLIRADSGLPWPHIARELGMTPAALDSLRRRFATTFVVPGRTKGEH